MSGHLKRKFNLEYEKPQKNLVSEGDKLIKDLVNKQLDTKVILQKELTCKSRWETPKELLNETEYLSGQNNFKEFNKQAVFLHTIQKLKSCGLSDDEIELYLDYEKGENYAKTKHKNLSITVLQTRYNNITKKISLKENSISQERNYSTVSRHVKQIAESTKPNSLETRLFKFASSCSANNETNTISKHPINNLCDLEQKLFGHLRNQKIPSLKKRRKKAKKFLETEDNYVELKNMNLSKWDIKDVTTFNLEEKNTTTKNYGCFSNKKYTIRNKEIVELSDTDKKFNSKINVNETNDKKYEKLSEQDIKKLSKFQTYEKGTPSNVLYIKNLAKQTTEHDLVKLFSNVDNENKIIYRLLKGKMRGQAFITFNNVDLATTALEKNNGIIVNNKPLIIQYGKKFK